MKKIIFSLLLMSICINVYANPYKSNGPYGVNCTWYTWNKVYEKTGIELPSWGNANTWYTSAENAGFSVGTTPKNNSVVVWNITSYGHVGYVERVVDGSIYVWDSDQSCISEEDEEYCYNNSVDESTLVECKKSKNRAACKYDASRDIIGFIYLDNAPKKSTSSSNNTPTKNITSSKKTIKSNNNYLKNITISNVDIDFNKDTLEYNIDVLNNIDNITINGELDSNKASLEGNGEYSLKEGINDIKLIVTAEDKSTREYILHINREEKIKEIISTNNKEDNSNNNLYKYIIVSSIIVVIIGTSIVLIKKKGKKNG